MKKMNQDIENNEFENNGEEPEKNKSEIKKEEKNSKTSKKTKKKDSQKKNKEIEELKKKNEELEEQNKEINDKFLRLYSEFDNYRKRTIKEKLELSKNATKDIILELLPVVDDFERAIEAFKSDDNGESIKEGILLIYNKLMLLLKAKGLEKIDAMGKQFDTDYHEAITQIPVEDEDQKDKVVDVVEQGYTLNDKVIRFAKVVVGK